MRWTWLLCAGPLVLMPFACTSSFSTEATGGGGSGGTAATTTASTGGSSGTVTGFVCNTPTDCPPPTSQCDTTDCVQHQCVKNPLPAGMMVPNRIVGNCTAEVCDGSGNQTTTPDKSDVYDDDNPCTADTCLNQRPQNTPQPKGTACTVAANPSAKVCDNGGNCVQCNKDGDCPGQICSGNQCAPSSCRNQSMDGSETDVDCGGTDCAPCPDGEKCLIGTDCTSGVCPVGSHICAAPSCTDTVKNGDETGPDCGGSCPNPCGNGVGCTVPGDCVSGVCVGGRCQTPTCSDGVQNGGETDKDCGGSTTCDPCPEGEKCVHDSDCANADCDSNGKCNHCDDGKVDFGESDVDCGASCSMVGGDLCAVGQHCTRNEDCTSNKCCSIGGMSALNVCAPDHGPCPQPN